MPIVLFHILAFKLVNLAVIVVQEEPMYRMAEFPAMCRTGLWWIFYTIIGVAVPLLAADIYWRACARLASWFKLVR